MISKFEQISLPPVKTAKMQLKSIWIIFLLFSVIHGCMPPQPDPLTDVDETVQGNVLFNIIESSTSVSASWSLSVVSPSDISTYLESFLRIEQNASNPLHWIVVLDKALDIEQIHNDTQVFLTLLTIGFTCRDTSHQNGIDFERFLYVSPISEFIPALMTDSIEFLVSEDSTIGSEVVNLMDYVVDGDIVDTVTLNDVERFHLMRYIGDGVDGAGVFTMTPTGKVILSRSVDYESLATKEYVLNVTIEDAGGLISWSKVHIRVTNANDNAPSFVLPQCTSACARLTEYRATVNPNTTGELTSVKPSNIRAIDRDGDILTYHIISGSPPDYEDFISIDPVSGLVSLTQQLSNANISHLTLVIEVTDRDTPKQAKALNETSHSTIASLLIFVSGRQIDFPAAPDPRINSSSASYNTDALFISVLALSVLLLCAIIALVALFCKLRKIMKRPIYPRANRCEALKDRSPSDWSIQLRPAAGNEGNENAFTRTLSQATTTGADGTHGFYNDSNECGEEVFTTNVAPHQITSPPPDHSARQAMIQQGIIPYHEALTHFTSSAGMDRQTDSSNEDVYTAMNTSLRGGGATESARQSDLESLYQALDVLTSVTPFPAQTEDHHTTSAQSPKTSPGPVTTTFDNTTNGGLAISESGPKSIADGIQVETNSNILSRNQMYGDARVPARHDSKVDANDNDFDFQLQPLNEFYFDGDFHQSLDKEHSTFKTSSSADYPFETSIQNKTRMNPNSFKQKYPHGSGTVTEHNNNNRLSLNGGNPTTEYVMKL